MMGSRVVVPFAVIMALMVILSYSFFCDARPLQQETPRNHEALVIEMSNSKMMKMMKMKDQKTSASQEEAVFSHLMGVVESAGDDAEDEEGCGREQGNGEDEEDCRMKRRMMADAHLDYIYTQHHNHP